LRPSQNYTYEEAEEIRMEFEKICTCTKRVQGCADGSAAEPAEARQVGADAASAVEKFEAKVLSFQGRGGGRRGAFATAGVQGGGGGGSEWQVFSHERSCSEAAGSGQ